MRHDRTKPHERFEALCAKRLTIDHEERKRVHADMAEHIRTHPINTQVGPCGMPVLHRACSWNIPTVIDACLASGSDISQSHNDSLPIHSLVCSHVNEYPLHLDALVAAGADINARDSRGRTPLLYAVCRRSVENHRGLAQRLIDQGADPNGSHMLGAIPLIHALLHGTTEDTAVLLRAGASLQVSSLSGDAPIFCATSSQKIQLLIDHALDLHNESAIAVVLRAQAPLMTSPAYMDSENAKLFKSAWLSVEHDLDPSYKLNGLVALMCHQGPLTAWATQQLSELGSESKPS